MEIRTTTTLPEFAGFRGHWDRLLDRAPEDDPFVTWEWLTSWWEAFGTGREMCLVTAWSGNELVGAAPLLKTRGIVRGREHTVLGFWENAYSNRIKVVVDRDRALEVLRAIMLYAVQEVPDWEIAHLGPVVAESPTTQLLVQVLRELELRYWMKESYRSPYLVLPDRVDSVLKGLGPAYRKTVRRKLNGAARAGLEPELAGDPQRLNSAFEISAETWQHGEGTGIGSSDPVRCFYARLATAAAARGWLQLAFLHDRGTPICFEYNLLYKNRAYNLKLDYRPEYAPFSPGLVLRYRVIENLVARGATEYDFLGADEEYKLRWSSRVRPHSTIVIVRNRSDFRFAHFVYSRLRPYLQKRAPWLLALRRRLREVLPGRK